MSWQFTPYIIPLIFAAIVMCSLVVFTWRRRAARGAVPFMILMAAIAQWLVSYILELSGADLETKLLGFHLSFIGIASVPTAWFIFTLMYTGRGYLIRWPRWLIFLVIPALTLVLIWTWDSHHLFWRDITLQENFSSWAGTYLTLHTVNGPLYYVHAVYSYSLILVGTVFILQALFGLPRPFWGQKVTLLLSVVIAWMANAIYITGISPIPGLDLTAFAFTISGVGLAWSLFGFRLLELIPIAHETIFRNMEDGFILLDTRLNIQDLNPAAAHILQVDLTELVGKPAGEALTQLPILDVLKSNSSSAPDSRPVRVEFTLSDDENRRDFDLHVSKLTGRAGDATGWLVTLRDITYQKITEEYLQRRAAFLEVFNHIIAAAATAEDLDGMLCTALDDTLHILDMDRGVIWIQDSIILRGITPEANQVLADLCETDSAGGSRFDQVGVLHVDDWSIEKTIDSLWSGLAGNILEHEIMASMSVPIRSRNEYIGYFTVVSSTARHWEQEEISLMDAVGHQVGLVADRLLQWRETQDRNCLMARLIEVSAALNRHFSVNEVLPTISQAAADLLNPDRVNIFLGDLEPAADQAQPAPDRPMPDPSPVLVKDAARVLNGNAEVQNLDYRAMGSWPLVYEERTLAVITLYYNQPHEWSSAALDVMQAFIRQAAIALENARLFDAEREQYILAEALRDLATVVNSTLDFNEVLEQILANLGWALPHDRADIMLVEEGVARVVHSRGYDKVGLSDWAHTYAGVVEDVPLLKELVQSGQVLSLPDTLTSPLWTGFQPGSTCRAYLGAPIIRKGFVVGLINVYSQTAGIYTIQHIRTLRAFTDQAAIALDNASLYASLQEQADETSALYRAVTRLFTPGGDLTVLAEEIARAVTNEFNSAHCSVLIYDESTDELKTVAQSGYYQVNPKRLRVDGPGLTVTAFRTGEIVYAPDVNADPRYVSGTPHTHSEMSLPLRSHGQVFGILNLESPELDGFSEKDRRILSAFADRAALAIENTRLFELTDFQLRQINLLNSITRASLEAFDFHIMLAVMVDRLRDLFNAQGCYVALWDEEQQSILPGTGSQEVDEVSLHFTPSPDVPSLVDLVLQSSAPLVIENVSASTKIHPRLVSVVKAQAILGLALIANQQKLGAVLVLYDRPRHFSMHELRLMEQAAGQVALAIGRARSLESSQRRAQEAENLRQATAALTAALDLRQVLDNILDHLEQVIPYDRASVYLLEEQTLHAVAARGFVSEQQVLGYNFPASNAIAQQIIQVSHPLILEDATLEPRFTGWIETGFVHGWMGVPLVIHGSLIGILTLGRQVPGAFGRDQANLAQAFGSQAAAAIANARLFSEVQRLAITDPLTGLYNRRGFAEIGHREIERTRRYKRPLSCVLLDIDHFKRINDTYKHAIGDQVLRTLADRCRNRTREVDILGRYGGEEMVILLPETDRAGALVAAEHLRRDVADEPFETEVGPLWVTISLGVADSIDGKLELDALVDRADAAMYAAKQSGRNRVVSY
jgi:diguanylate cyclase (GGDEF)-like protein/PAS domain S-box-containing protein